MSILKVIFLLCFCNCLVSSNLIVKSPNILLSPQLITDRIKFILFLIGQNGGCCKDAHIKDATKFPRNIYINFIDDNLNLNNYVIIEEQQVNQNLAEISQNLMQYGDLYNFSITPYLTIKDFDNNDLHIIINNPHIVKRQLPITQISNSSEVPNVDWARLTYSMSKPTRADYPALFNLIFWLSLALALTVYVLVVALWHVSPGDSIIYRVTNSKYKKDL